MPLMRLSAKKLVGACVVSIALGLWAGPVAAFNGKAHQVVGYIAAASVCSATLNAVEGLDSERNLATAGLWADEIRAYKHMDFAKRWHFINVPDEVTVAKFLADGRRRRQGDVLFAIEHFARLLGDPSADQLDRAQAYRFLVHFVADVHQPLHVGRSADQGGNRVNVQVGERRTNLHSFWDGFELSGVIDAPHEYADYLLQRYGGADVDRGGEPVDWAQESKNLRPQVYAFSSARPSGAPVLSDDYREKAINIINLRIYQAGRRLATMLDAIFCEGDGSR
jgi:hypothetical protein